MIGYLILLELSIVLIASEAVGGIGRYLIALLPVLPFAFAMRATANNVRNL